MHRSVSCGIGQDPHFQAIAQWARATLGCRRIRKLICRATSVRRRQLPGLRLAQANGASSMKGISIELTKSHQELASELGTVRELISRNLGRLQAEGFLQVDGRKIIVKDLEGLKDEQSANE